MSWFTDLAGKAEDFLNQIDHNAANVLQKPKSGGTGSSPSHRKSQSGSAGTWSTSGARSAEVFLGDTYGASLGVTESVSAASNYQQQTTKYEQRFKKKCYFCFYVNL